MKTFVLIHGSYHGSWCFDKLIPFLESSGNLVIAIDLPDFIEMKREISLDDYFKAIDNEIQKINDKVILVGHSLGGHIISNFAEMRPERIDCLVYLTATLLPSGKSNADIPRNEDEIPDYPRIQKNDLYKWFLNENEQDKKKIMNLFYNDCSLEDADEAIQKLRKQPIKPTITPNHLTNERFGQVKRYYIECLNDKSIFPSVQNKMYTSMPCTKVYSMNSSHSPFLSNPVKLAKILLEIGKECS